jgi:hypothetical protein
VVLSDRRRNLSCLAALIALAAFAAPREAAAQAAATASNALTIPTLQSPPPLDPKADLAAWKDAAVVSLPWDVQHQKPSSEPATARVETDGTNIYVRFDVKQRETLLAQQHTNDVGDGTDDEVWIDLWPNGSSGFYYQFAATSNGTHYQYSSENTAYGAASGNDFVVTMRIPITVMRGSGGSAGWNVQFVRIVRSTGERQIWTYGPAQTNGDDVTYAGAMNGLASAIASRPKPRVALYGLAGAGSSDSGLTTSRMGGDFSVPVTATSSFYGTIHPDFSNVEIDQQTISPTAYQRSFNEVRPFFTQGASFYDSFDCDACPYVAQLYTPAIPTPRDGYAFEGKQGRFSFAAFDAVGTGRNDGAAALVYRTPDNHWRFTEQTVAVNLPGLTDHTDTTGIAYNDNKHVSGYFNYGKDHGTNVADGSQAQRYDVGTFLYSNTFGFAASARKVGAYYEPVDGFVQHADIAGYALYENKIWLFDKKSWLNKHPARHVHGPLSRAHRRAEPDRQQHRHRSAHPEPDRPERRDRIVVPAARRRRLHADLAERRRPDLAQRDREQPGQLRLSRLLGDADDDHVQRRALRPGPRRVVDAQLDDARRPARDALARSRRHAGLRGHRHDERPVARAARLHVRDRPELLVRARRAADHRDAAAARALTPARLHQRVEPLVRVPPPHPARRALLRLRRREPALDAPAVPGEVHPLFRRRERHLIAPRPLSLGGRLVSAYCPGAYEPVAAIV